ncbi:avirulence protein [Dyella sp. LX-66]|uniref:DUF6055 domain-containing protein n=1 Tax=unclassified Dyella TaxID=2634549 RepID=UPI001BDFFADA|nr:MULTISPECIES: DUF6055 domain-containing protein [unclassified Dyella]MBT2117170.1 avirulence protein [Dyella sp. LX-1]MBT2139754.1 avirulence protein [Dyella sp. LX-66]
MLASTAAVHAATPSWVTVAREGQSFTVSGTSQVRYGLDTHWVTRSISGTAQCTNAYFGTDPYRGQVKQCQVPSATPSDTVDNGTTGTTWPNTGGSKPATVSGTWIAGGPSPDHADFRLVKESPHFAFYSNEAISDADLAAAADTLENTVWHNMFDANLYMPEPFHDTATKIKPSIHISSSFGLTGGGWDADHVGMWIGPGTLLDHWGLTHEFTHAWQFWTGSHGGLGCPDSDTCGWIAESHANYTAHQLPEYTANPHCTEMLANVSYLYLGSSRERYCNWQFMEFLKDKYGAAATTAIYTTGGVDPFTNLMSSRGWTLAQLNDFFGDWAMHNVTWDYKVSAAGFRSSYGNIVATDKAERTHRLMPMEALDADWASNHRFVSPFYGAPQRFGYNIVRLYPTAGAGTVTVKFRGVDQPGSNADFRWGLVATDAQFTTSRYSQLHRGLDDQLTFKVNPGEPLFLVVTATPSVYQTIVAEQAYGTIWRYPYMIELANAWPQGFQNGQRDACSGGLVRHSNGGGCVPQGTPTSVYVGPYATVMLGTHVSGTARIEDEAVVANGTVSGGIVGGLSVIGETGSDWGNNSFSVSGSAQVRTTHYPLGFFESGQGASGSVNLLGDVEYRGVGLNLQSGNRSGFVDADSTVGTSSDINTRAQIQWR